MAKGVRKPKSKLAGSVEMFALFEANIHFGKSNLATLTGARMIKFYANIVKDYSLMEVASKMLKEINRVAENVENSEFFEILDKSLSGLDANYPFNLVEIWFVLNLKRAMGEQINLYTDVDGLKLEENKRYDWDGMEMAFLNSIDGAFDADAIKVLRLIVSVDLAVVFRVKGVEKYMPEILKIMKSW